MEKRVLGKGLEALIPKKINSVKDQGEDQEFTHLQVELIQPGKYQPRKDIDKDELEELKQSIKEKGFIQPIVVRKIDDKKYEVVAGERRFQVAKSLGLKELPVMIKRLDDKDAFIFAIVENLQRKDLNPIEEAEALKRLMDEFKFILEDVARFVGKDKTTVVNILRLLKLPQEIRSALQQGIITRSQARTILGAQTIAEQQNLFRQIISEKLSVREIEQRVKKISNKKQTVDPFVFELEGKLQKQLGTKVKVFNKRNNKGRLVIEYYSLEDLERILKCLQ